MELADMEQIVDHSVEQTLNSIAEQTMDQMIDQIVDQTSGQSRNHDNNNRNYVRNSYDIFYTTCNCEKKRLRYCYEYPVDKFIGGFDVVKYPSGKKIVVHSNCQFTKKCVCGREIERSVMTITQFSIRKNTDSKNKDFDENDSHWNFGLRNQLINEKIDSFTNDQYIHAVECKACSCHIEFTEKNTQYKLPSKL